MITMCKEVAASLINAETKQEQETVYENFKEEIEKFDKSTDGKRMSFNFRRS